MVKCINEQCTNYNQELEDTKICPACGKDTEKFAVKTNSSLGITSILAAIIAAIISVSVYGLFGMIIAIGLSIASIIMAIVSKKKVFIVMTVLSLAVVVPMAVSLFSMGIF